MELKERRLFNTIKEILEQNPLGDITDEELIEALIEKTNGEVFSYLDPNLKSEVRIRSGKLVSKSAIVDYKIKIIPGI